MGIVQAKDKYRTLENLIAHKNEIVSPILDFVREQGRKAGFLVANSGTPTMVCAFKMGLEEYDSKKVFGQILKVEDFEWELARFQALSEKQKQGLAGIFRADVVPFGIVLFLFFMEVLGFRECLIIDEGVREGAAILGIENRSLQDLHKILRENESF